MYLASQGLSLSLDFGWVEAANEFLSDPEMPVYPVV